MRRCLAAYAVAALCVLGATGSSAAAEHGRPSSGSVTVHDATSVVRVAAVAVPAPQHALPYLGLFAVLVGTSAVGALLLGYLARQRRQALLVPIFESTVRRRGPPASHRHG